MWWVSCSFSLIFLACFRMNFWCSRHNEFLQDFFWNHGTGRSIPGNESWKNMLIFWAYGTSTGILSESHMFWFKISLSHSWKVTISEVLIVQVLVLKTLIDKLIIACFLNENLNLNNSYVIGLKLPTLTSFLIIH